MEKMKNSVFSRSLNCSFATMFAMMFAMTFAAILLVGLSACGRFQPTLDLDSPAEKAVARHDDQSENIADEGEALLIPQSLEKARAKFLQAIELNPENARALFWRDTVDLILEFKGIVARLRPLYESTPEGSRQYADLQRALGPRYSDAQVRFLQAGHPDIHTNQEAAEFLDRMRLRVYKLRTTVRNIRDTEITLTLPKELIGDKSDQSKASCGS
jgi:tetratricopeptide (TPR) repeat protein